MASTPTERSSLLPPRPPGPRQAWQAPPPGPPATYEDPKWGATPALRRNFSQDSDDVLVQASAAVLRNSPSLRRRPLRGEEEGSAGELVRESPGLSRALFREVLKLPALLIGMVLNLMLAVPFGSSFFPLDWEPFPVSRMMGIQMWIFSTFLCQLVMTFGSDFRTAMGMQMVENIPFMHSLAAEAVARLGTGKEALATTMVSFALSTVIVGFAFLLLGYFKLGNATYFFPKHVIIGCIGGIGLFVLTTGFEVATNLNWEWSLDGLGEYRQWRVVPMWLIPVVLELLLRILLRMTKWNLLPPFYFISIPPLFYVALLVVGVPVKTARDEGYFFDAAEHADVLLMWKVLDFRLVDWSVVVGSWPTILALTIFSLMHAPINIPSLSISVGTEVNMNKELVTHGISNLVTGFAGGLQNYLCYSNSLLLARCGGGGRFQGFTLAALLALFFFIGPDVVTLVPRCMAGCLLIHIGLDLTAEALVDSLGQFDSFEYGSILLITMVMTVRGMTAGLGLGVLCSAFAFTLQQAKHAHVIRGVMTAATLKSSKWRSPRETEILRETSRRILVVQLQGNIFFGNSTQITEELQRQLSKVMGQIKFVILDFTVVMAIDSSASDTVTKVAQLCQNYGDISVCFCRGNSGGFPCAAPLSQRLQALEDAADGGRDEEDNLERQERKWVSLQDDLDSALAWCEDGLLVMYADSGKPAAPFENVPHMYDQLRALLPDVPLQGFQQMLEFFEERYTAAGDVLWVQGSPSNSCGLLVEGALMSQLEEEAGTTEDVSPGAMIGEFGLVNNRRRGSTLRCVTRAKLLWLTRERYDQMKAQRGDLALLLARICIGYLERRVTHVSNRIWESRCLPI